MDLLNQKERACTSILVGKNATIDGSTIIARNDDTFLTIAPHNFLLNKAVTNQPNRVVESYLNDFKASIPDTGYSWTAVPNVDYKNHGYYDESGINGKNVAMSATESTYGNERTLAYDPLCENGLDEDCMVRMVLPFIETAREGVLYLGDLIKKFGSVAGNSVLFSDQDDVWYMEIVTGHHWVAQRIPDDSYAICANRVSIQQVDFTDKKNFIWSENIEEFVDTYQLNTDKTGFNFRHIFGTSSLKDRYYNNPRVWFGQKYFNPEIDQNPEDQELPFIRKANHKITIEDLEYVLGSHYNETIYDTMSSKNLDNRTKYRPIGLNRTQNSHILQIRNNVPFDIAGLMWLCIGFPTFSPHIPFYTQINDTPQSYKNVPKTFDMNYSYWLYRAMSMLVESHYSDFLQDNIDYISVCQRHCRAFIAETDNQIDTIKEQEITEFLTKKNENLSQIITDETKQFMDNLFVKGIELSKLTFNMDKNL